MKGRNFSCRNAARALTIFVGWERAIVAVAGTMLLAACGTLPMQVDRPPVSALRASPDSALARIALDSIPSPELTGFRLMPLGSYSLDTRVELARRAKQSLDLQYYLI